MANDKTIQFRVSLDEYNRLAQSAKKENLTISQFCRKNIIKKRGNDTLIDEAVENEFRRKVGLPIQKGISYEEKERYFQRRIVDMGVLDFCALRSFAKKNLPQPLNKEQVIKFLENLYYSDDVETKKIGDFFMELRLSEDTSIFDTLVDAYVEKKRTEKQMWEKVSEMIEENRGS